MAKETVVDEQTGRKCYLDIPSDLRDDDRLTFLLNLHGGGSAGAWQREYFPACDFVDAFRLVVATPTAATAEPMRHWSAEVDDEHLRNIVELVYARFGRSRDAAGDQETIRTHTKSVRESCTVGTGSVATHQLGGSRSGACNLYVGVLVFLVNTRICLKCVVI